MLADFFTKPLQGTPFRIFQDDIMGIDPRLAPTMDHRSVLGLGTEDTENTVETADGENSLNDDAKDTGGHFKTKGHFMTNSKTKGHSMNNSMTNCVFGIVTKNKQRSFHD